MSVVIYDKNFYKSFGFDKIDYFVGISYSMLMFSPLMSTINILLVQLSRKNEFQADEFALRFKHGDNLIRALVKIFKENKGDIDPDWLYSSVKHTHPTLLQRVARMQTLMGKDK